MADLVAQVVEESKAIKDAPIVPSAGHIGRCSFCGRIANRLTLVEVVHQHEVGGARTERWKGECCGG